MIDFAYLTNSVLAAYPDQCVSMMCRTSRARNEDQATNQILMMDRWPAPWRALSAQCPEIADPSGSMLQQPTAPLMSWRTHPFNDTLLLDGRVPFVVIPIGPHRCAVGPLKYAANDARWWCRSWATMDSHLADTPEQARQLAAKTWRSLDNHSNPQTEGPNLTILSAAWSDAVLRALTTAVANNTPVVWPNDPEHPTVPLSMAADLAVRAQMNRFRDTGITWRAAALRTVHAEDPRNALRTLGLNELAWMVSMATLHAAVLHDLGSDLSAHQITQHRALRARWRSDLAYVRCRMPPNSLHLNILDACADSPEAWTAVGDRIILRRSAGISSTDPQRPASPRRL